MARRRPRISTLMSLVLCWASAAPAAPDERAETIDRIRSSARAGRHDQVEAQARALLDTLPPEDRPDAWSIDLDSRWAHDARIGQRHVYLVSILTHGETPARWPELAPEQKHVTSRAGEYGWLITVVCVDGMTGRPLWLHQVAPRTRMAIDPRDDALWTWDRAEGSSILRIDASTGAETCRGLMPRYTERVDAVRGLKVAGVRLWSNQTPNEVELSPGDELDVDTGEVRRQATHPALLSPSGTRALRAFFFQAPGDAATTVSVVPAAAGDREAPSWSFRSGGYSDNPPVWFGDDALILAGTIYSYGAVSRVDGRTGKVRWTRALPESAHSPGRTTLVRNAHAPRGWSAVGEAAGKVIVLGSFGTVFFLDPETGDQVAQFSTGTPLLALPRIIAGCLVLADGAGIRGVPMRRILGEVKRDDDWLTLQELRARSFLAQGRAADSLAIAEVVARSVKDSPVGWSLLAESREALGRGSEALAARVAAMAAAGSLESPALRKSHGLLWRLPTAPVTAPPVVDGRYLVVGCRDGRLLSIDTQILRVTNVEQAPVDIAMLSLDTTKVSRRGDDHREVAVRTLESPAGDLRPGDPLLPGDEPPGLPQSWYSAMGRDGPSVVVGNRRARGLGGGGVRVFDDRVVVERPPRIKIEWWRIKVVGTEPLGYGTGGVYRLDRDLLPAERIIDAGQESEQSTMVHLLDGDDDSLCVLAGPYKAMQLQLWSRDATRLLREVAVHSSVDFFREPYRLRRLGDGYLLSAGELVWLPKAAGGRVWRFSVYLDPAAGPSQPRFDSNNSVFGVPRVVGDRLFVAARGGGIYGFALSEIVGAAGDRRQSRRSPAP